MMIMEITQLSAMVLLVAHLIAVLLHMTFSDGGYGADEDGIFFSISASL